MFSSSTSVLKVQFCRLDPPSEVGAGALLVCLHTHLKLETMVHFGVTVLRRPLIYPKRGPHLSIYVYIYIPIYIHTHLHLCEERVEYGSMGRVVCRPEISKAKAHDQHILVSGLRVFRGQGFKGVRVCRFFRF